MRSDPWTIPTRPSRRSSRPRRKCMSMDRALASGPSATMQPAGSGRTSRAKPAAKCWDVPADDLPAPFFRRVIVVAPPFDYASRDFAIMLEVDTPLLSDTEGNQRPNSGHEHNLNNARAFRTASCKTANLSRKALAHQKAVLGPALPKGSVGPGCFWCPLAGVARAASVSALLFRWERAATRDDSEA